MLTALPLSVASALALGVSVVFGLAVRHVDSTHRLALSLLCLIGAGVYLGMASCNIIYHNPGTVIVAAALLATSSLLSLFLWRRGAEPWPDEEAEPRRQTH